MKTQGSAPYLFSGTGRYAGMWEKVTRGSSARCAVTAETKTIARAVFIGGIGNLKTILDRRTNMCDPSFVIKRFLGENFPAPVLAELREGALPSAPFETQQQARESNATPDQAKANGSDSRGGETSRLIVKKEDGAYTLYRLARYTEGGGLQPERYVRTETANAMINYLNAMFPNDTVQWIVMP